MTDETPWCCSGWTMDCALCDDPTGAIVHCPGHPATDANTEAVRVWQLHARHAHPDYEYATTRGPRKQWDDADQPPVGDDGEPEAGWEPNTAAGRDGWDRFDYHEEAYWRRPKNPEQSPRTTPDNPATSSDTADNSLREQIAAALLASWDTGVNMHRDEAIRRDTDAVMAVRDRRMQQLAAGRATWKAKAEEIERHRDRLADQVDQLTARLGQYADRAVTNGQRADQLDTTLREVVDAFEAYWARASYCGPGESAVQPEHFRAWRGALKPAAHGNGPTVAEAAADDRAHWPERQWGGS